jgi:hypothetical protein
MESKLIGYVRKSNNGNALKLNISAEAFEEAQRYTTQDGKEYVNLITNLEKIKEIIDDQREVTSISQILN